MNNVDDMVNCVDQAGNPTGIPDIPFVTTEVVHQCSPVSYPVAPPQILCETRGEHPQTYQANVGRGHYYKKKHGDVHGIYIFSSDIRAARNATFASLGQLRQVCCESDQDVDMSSRSQQAEYAPAVQAMKDNQSNYAQATGPFNMTVALRKEAKLQGVTDVDVWDCGTQCYAREFLEQGGADVEGQYVDTLYLPFFDPAERKANKMTAAFVKHTGEDEAGGLGGVYAFAAGLAFKEAVDRVVEQHGVNGLTREKPVRGARHDQRVRRRWSARSHRPRGSSDHRLPRAAPGPRRRLRAGAAEEARDVPLRPRERRRDQARLARELRCASILGLRPRQAKKAAKPAKKTTAKKTPKRTVRKAAKPAKKAAKQQARKAAKPAKRTKSAKAAKKAAKKTAKTAKRATKKPRLLAGGNQQIAKRVREAPVRPTSTRCRAGSVTSVVGSTRSSRATCPVCARP